MTYFFSDGKIHIISNKLHKQTSDDYDKEGTAKMVVNTLCETLGVTKQKLASILKHFVYDGVYAGIIGDKDIGINKLLGINKLFESTSCWESISCWESTSCLDQQTVGF